MQAFSEPSLMQLVTFPLQICSLSMDSYPNTSTRCTRCRIAFLAREIIDNPSSSITTNWLLSAVFRSLEMNGQGRTEVDGFRHGSVTG